MFDGGYQAACLHTEDEALFLNNYGCFPRETGAHDDIQLSCDHFLQGKRGVQNK